MYSVSVLSSSFLELLSSDDVHGDKWKYVLTMCIAWIDFMWELMLLVCIMLLHVLGLLCSAGCVCWCSLFVKLFMGFHVMALYGSFMICFVDGDRRRACRF